MFGLMVRFTCKDEAAAAGFDDLVARTGEQIRANEPGTVIYTVHRLTAVRWSVSSTSSTGTRTLSKSTSRRTTCRRS